MTNLEEFLYWTWYVLNEWLFKRGESRQELYERLLLDLDDNVIPIYEIPFDATSDLASWDIFFVIERLHYYKKISYEPLPSKTPGVRRIKSFLIDERRNPYTEEERRYDFVLGLPTIYGTMSEKSKDKYNQEIFPVIKPLLLQTYGSTHAERAILTLFLIRKHCNNEQNPDNESKNVILNILPRDVVVLIGKHLWNTRNESCWTFDEHKLVQELGSSKEDRYKQRIVKYFRISTREDYWYISKLIDSKVDIWIEFIL